MRFYNGKHKHFCGIDLHARTMYVCVLDHEGEVLLHRNLPTDPEVFLKTLAPYRDSLVVAVECMLTWYWLADLCAREGIDFVLGHALYMKAIHGGKAKNDRLDALKIATLLRGGNTLPPEGGGRMPWLETNPVLERRHFIHDYESGHWSVTELCLRYGISRNTGYKWLDRYRQSGGSGLHDRSRAPHTSPNQTPDEVLELILEENSRYGWGARKILKRLKTRLPDQLLPARSTVFDILERHGRVHPRRRRRR